MPKLPAFQFYPGDWRKDPGVQSLSFSERGIWIELLCLMHESESPGKLLLGGKPYPEDRLARLLGIEILLMREVISVLIELNVASLCVETGALMNRRMVKDRQLTEIRAKAGKMGGNPLFQKGQSNPYYVKKDKQTDKQKITPSSSTSSSTSEEEGNAPAYTIYREFFPKFQLAIHQTEMLQTAEVDEAEFRDCLNFWAGHGYAERNVIGLLDCYNSKNYKPKPTKPEPKPEPKVMSGRERAAELDWIQKNTKITIPTPRNGTKKNDDNK